MKKNPERLIRQFYSSPRNPEIDGRKKRFSDLNEFVSRRHGWLTSVPGALDMTMECLPDSTLPAELRSLGWIVTEIGHSQRILPHAITERFVTDARGELELLTAESTRPVSTQVTHAGLAAIVQYDLRAPSVPPDQGARIAP